MSFFNIPSEDRPPDTRSSPELISLARSRIDDRYDDELGQAVGELQLRLPEIFPGITALAQSKDHRERELAAMVLGQSQVKDKALVDECFRELHAILNSDPDEALLVSAIFSTGHLGDVRTSATITRFAGHPSAQVRQAIASSLTGYDDKLAIDTSIKLSGDPESDVRNRALGALTELWEHDTQELRDAFAARLDDEEHIAQGGIFGLVMRLDPRSIGPLMEELHGSPYEIDSDAIQACIAKLHDSQADLGPEWQPVFKLLSKMHPDPDDS